MLYLQTRLTTQILWRAFAKEPSRLFSACNQQLRAILTAARKSLVWYSWWLQTRLSFFSGCLKDVTRVAAGSKRPRSALELVWFPPSAASVLRALGCDFTVEQTLSAFILHHCSRRVTRCSPGMAPRSQRPQRPKLFLEGNTHTAKLYDICICIHNIHSNRRTKSSRWLFLYCFSLRVIAISMEIAALIEIIGVWGP